MQISIEQFRLFYYFMTKHFGLSFNSYIFTNPKRHFLFLALLLVGIGLRAQTLVLHHADGTTTDVQLYLKPRIQFQNDRVLITSTVLDMDYPKENVLRFSYKGLTNDVKAVKRDADYSRENGQLVFHGIGQTEKVAVYNTNGIRVPVRLSRSGNDVTLPLASIPSGVYVLSVNGRTSKFSKP